MKYYIPTNLKSLTSGGMQFKMEQIIMLDLFSVLISLVAFVLIILSAIQNVLYQKDLPFTIKGSKFLIVIGLLGCLNLLIPIVILYIFDFYYPFYNIYAFSSISGLLMLIFWVIYGIVNRRERGYFILMYIMFSFLNGLFFIVEFFVLISWLSLIFLLLYGISTKNHLFIIAAGLFNIGVLVDSIIYERMGWMVPDPLIMIIILITGLFGIFYPIFKIVRERLSPLG